MHTIRIKHLEQKDFAYSIGSDILSDINDLIYRYNESKNMDYFYGIKNILPEGFLQKITYHMNYETAITILKQRRNHRLLEWKEIFCPWILSLPYMKELLGE